VPAVSVIIPAYNQAGFLAGAIRSALAQDFADLEVIVVDDGSTDATRAVAENVADARVRYVHQENRGLSAARNTGIRLARGAFLTFLDSDDEFLGDKLTVLMAAFDENPRLGLVAGHAILVDDVGRPLNETFERALPADTSELLLGNPLHVGSVLLRAEWQERVGLFDERLRSYEDWDLWLRLARAGCPMGSVSRPVSLYRFHREQMTRLGAQMTTACFAVLDKTYEEEMLPARWRARQNEAYSRAYLRAAAQAYTAGELRAAGNYMAAAVRLNPQLCAGNAELLAQLVAGWANHVKTSEPLEFLERLYSHLPVELDVLRGRRRHDLSRQAMHLAFSAHDRGDAPAARARIWQAAGYLPRVLLNRGVLSLLLCTGSTRRAAQREDQGAAGVRPPRE
jgi:glycosyltransferase involved in cell wall biosynthesis